MPSPQRQVRLAALLVAVTAAATATVALRRAAPWPGALAIRFLFDRDTARVNRALLPHAPTTVRSIRAVNYQPGEPKALLDVHFPATVEQGTGLPTVVWIHGGGWLSGSRNNAEPYFQLLAAAGYTVVAVDYPLAPQAIYPTALRQINRALSYVLQHADTLQVDPNRIFLAGDSAGAQLASQIVALATTPGYAETTGLEPALRLEHLRGAILHCGYYDMQAFLQGVSAAPWPLGWGIATVVRAYTGSRDHASAGLSAMSTINHLTPAFPPTFICGGNADPLTDSQSRPMAAKLTELGVPVTTRFYDKDHQPPLSHEFQFDLDTAAGREVLDATIAFVADRSHALDSDP